MEDNRRKIIISVHLPKTAGSAFRNSLAEKYKLYRDYDDDPVNSFRDDRIIKAEKDNELLSNIEVNPVVEVIHGHFLPYKYLGFAKKYNCQFVTWLREPIDRLISHYNYWSRYRGYTKLQRLHQKFLDEYWSFEHLCFNEEVRNTYCQFLYKFPISNFSFIGIFENYEEDLKILSEILGEELKNINFYKTEDVNKTNKNNIDFIKKEDLDKDFLEKVKEFHKADIDLYNEVLKLRGIK